ncbi:MAG: HAMP domain-containing histidine kinase, partial [Candidatus Cloacimonetes bacterium]|nr:HAMP domain-containing histidine kinase [Candidatus Cloacimonadota bacterium]
GYATIESAVEAMKREAYDFLPKPFTPDELRLVTHRAIKKRKLILETNRLREEKDRMRENFISMVSHQLRTPLVAVQQYFEVILGGMVGEVSEEQKNMLNRSKIRIDELIQLIKEWLDFAKIDANKLVGELKPTNLIPILSKILDSLQSLAKQNNVTLKMDVPKNLALISGNTNVLEQVFLNLVENSIRYNKDDGNVTITAGMENGYVKVEVSDTGIGISKHDIPFIFDQFYQVKQGNRTDGTGLGLSIVKKIIDAHFGTIEVTSELGQGTTFRILLPKIQEGKNE